MGFLIFDGKVFGADNKKGQDETPTENSDFTVKSGGIYTVTHDHETRIAALEAALIDMASATGVSF